MSQRVLHLVCACSMLVAEVVFINVGKIGRDSIERAYRGYHCAGDRRCFGIADGCHGVYIIASALGNWLLVYTGACRSSRSCDSSVDKIFDGRR